MVTRRSPTSSRASSTSLRAQRSNPFFLYAARWIASRSLPSGAHSRDPVARNDDAGGGSPRYRAMASRAELMPGLSPDEAAKAAVAAVHAARAELRALVEATPPAPAELVEATRQQLITVRASAIAAAMRNLETRISEEGKAVSLYLIAEWILADATLTHGDVPPIEHAVADAYRARLLAQRMVAEARDLLAQAKGIPEGN